MANQRDEVINEAIEKLKTLTGEDFHGYRSEIWRVISAAMLEQDKITRHACAEKVSMRLQERGCPQNFIDDASGAAINTCA